MSKIAKGVFKFAKKIVKGVVKVFKKIVKSPIFKIALIALAVYTGGAALGAWGSAAPSGIAAAEAATTTATLGGTGTVAGIAASTTPTIVTSALPALAPELVTISGIGNTAGALAKVAALNTAGGVASSNFFTKALTFMQTNPKLTSMAFQGLSSAFSPDEEDLISARGSEDRKYLDAQEEIRRKRWESLIGIKDVRLNIKPGDSILETMEGTPWHDRLKRTVGG